MYDDYDEDEHGEGTLRAFMGPDGKFHLLDEAAEARKMDALIAFAKVAISGIRESLDAETLKQRLTDALATFESVVSPIGQREGR